MGTTDIVVSWPKDRQRQTITGVPHDIQEEAVLAGQSEFPGPSMYIYSATSPTCHSRTCDSSCQTDGEGAGDEEEEGMDEAEEGTDEAEVRVRVHRIRAERGEGSLAHVSHMSASWSGKISSSIGNTAEPRFHSLPRLHAPIHTDPCHTSTPYCLEDLPAGIFCCQISHVQSQQAENTLPSAPPIPNPPPPESQPVPSYPTTPSSESQALPSYPMTSSPESQPVPSYSKTPSPESQPVPSYPTTPSPESQPVPSYSMTPSPKSQPVPSYPTTSSLKSQPVPSYSTTPSPESQPVPSYSMTPSPKSQPVPSYSTTPLPKSQPVPSYPMTPSPESQALPSDPTDWALISHPGEVGITCSESNPGALPSSPLSSCCSGPVQQADYRSLSSVGSDDVSATVVLRSHSYSSIAIGPLKRDMYQCRQHHSHDHASLCSSRSLHRNISLRKAKKPPPPPTRTDSLCRATPITSIQTSPARSASYDAPWTLCKCSRLLTSGCNSPASATPMQSPALATSTQRPSSSMNSWGSTESLPGVTMITMVPSLSISCSIQSQQRPSSPTQGRAKPSVPERKSSLLSSSQPPPPSPSCTSNPSP
ncbi:hypothetical protein SKAU_G00426000, partial [Synaphobranchus kaupii]